MFKRDKSASSPSSPVTLSSSNSNSNISGNSSSSGNHSRNGSNGYTKQYLTRRHLHKTLDHYNSQNSNDSITNINTGEHLSTSVQFFSIGELSNLFHKWLTYIIFLFVLLFCCMSVGPLLWLPISNPLNGGCSWCKIFKLEWLVAFIIMISSIFHFTIRRDLFPLFLAVGLFIQAITTKEPFLEPYVITLPNFIIILNCFLFVFFPSTKKLRSFHDKMGLNGSGMRKSTSNSTFFKEKDEFLSIYGFGSDDNYNTNHNGHPEQVEEYETSIKAKITMFFRKRNMLDLILHFIITTVIVAILFSTIFMASILTLAKGFQPTDSVTSYFQIGWNVLVDILYLNQNNLVNVNESIVRLIAILYLTVLATIYHFEIRKPYTLMSIASLLSQVAIALYLLETSMMTIDQQTLLTTKVTSLKQGYTRIHHRDHGSNPYGGGIFYMLNVVSCLSFFTGLAIDVVTASGEKYTRWKAEGERLHRRLSIELNQQSDFVKKVYQDGTQQLLEKYDFFQKFIDRLLLPVNEISINSRDLSSLEANKWQRQFINSIQNYSQQTLNILDDIKLVLAIESGEITREDISFNIYILLEEIFDIVSKDLNNNNIELVYRVNPDVPQNLIGDPGPLLQMILQLLKNAIRFTDKGDVGIIFSKVKTPPGENENDDDVYLEISVFDSGVGMNEQQLKQCNEFQPFPTFSTSKSKKQNTSSATNNNNSSVEGDTNENEGTGLGLFICNKIAKCLNGSFMAERNVDGGMTFVARVVLQEDRTEISGKNFNGPFDLTDEQNELLKDLPVLIIDDNQHVRFSIQQLLAQFGCNVHNVSSTVEGIRELKLASTLSNPFKLLLVDYVMPSCDGLETIQMLKDNPLFEDIKIILLLSPSDLLLKDEKTLQITTMTKPITPTNLLQGISKAYGIPLPSTTKYNEKLIGKKMISGGTTRYPYQLLNSGKPIIRILVGEANQDIQNQIQTIIEPFKYYYTNVFDGANVVSLAKKNYYDIIIVNLDLPILNGYEVATLIRSQETNGNGSTSSGNSNNNNNNNFSDNNNGDDSTLDEQGNRKTIGKRRESLPNLYRTSSSNNNTTNSSGGGHFISQRRKCVIPIVGLSNVPITNDILSQAKESGINHCVYINQLSTFLNNYLLDMERKRKIHLFSPQKLFTPLLKGFNGKRNHFDVLEPLKSPSLSPLNLDLSIETPKLKSILANQQQSSIPTLQSLHQQSQQQNQDIIALQQNQLQQQQDQEQQEQDQSTQQQLILDTKNQFNNSMMNSDGGKYINGLSLMGSNGNLITLSQPSQQLQQPQQQQQIIPRRKSQKRLQDLENVISRFVPIEFQQLIAPSGMENVYLGDAISKTITIFFSDIRDFTSTTEKMLVDDVIDFLNTYLAFAIPAITDKGGFIDKFIGDAIMAIFPHTDIQEQAISAVKAAIGMMKSLDFMSESGFRFNTVETGIGINTGKTIIGIVGTETRMEPTALGDAVNLASRTEPLCKEYGSRILVTQFTVEAIGSSIDEFAIRLVDSVRVKGKSEAVDIYEIIDGERDDIRVLKMAILPSFSTAIEYFKNFKYEQAYELFKVCNQVYPEDKPTLLFLQRCMDILQQ